MLSANKVFGGGEIKAVEDSNRLVDGLDILESFYEQHEVDLQYTVLTVYGPQ